MINVTKATRLAVLMVGVATLSACSTTPFSNSQRINTAAPQNLTPVRGSSVQSSTLPPLQGQDGVVVSGDPFDPNNDQFDPYSTGDPQLGAQANADGSFVNLDEVGGGTTPAGRDLSGSLTPGKLLGAWTISGDLKQCRLNLTQTTKSGTNRYRASTPNCEIVSLSLVSSWQLLGSTVQLFDESGALVAALQLTGNRFIGTASGGIAVAMEG